MNAIATPSEEDVRRWEEKHGIATGVDGWFDKLPAGAAPVTPEQIIDNVARNALRHDVPNLRHAAYTTRTMVFVAGGPSAAGFCDEIRAKTADPAYDVFCSNATAKWLLEHDIVPRYQVIIDPKPGKVADVAHRDARITYLLGLQCAPEVFDAVGGLTVRKFLAVSASTAQRRDVDEAKAACIPDDPVIVCIGGGTMMGTRALTLADALGYRRIEYYGFDGSIQLDGRNVGYYAYDKPRGEAITEVECEDGRRFDSTLTFSRQAHELVAFREQMPWLDIVIHGDGFLAHTLALEKLKDPPVDTRRITPEYEALQRQMAPAYEGAGRAYAARVFLLAAQMLKRFGALSVLNYGCGKCALEQAIEATFPALPGLFFDGYDPGIPELAAEPAPADLVVCTDVMEHVEPQCVDAVLQHIQSTAQRAAFFAIDTAPALKTLPDGRNAHICQQPATWWQGRLKKYFVLIEAATSGDVAIFVCQRFPRG